jgi:hypothetical protein
VKILRSGFLVLAFAGALVTSSVTLAGLKRAPQVDIVDNARLASGGLGAARNSSDNIQFIGCYYYRNAGVCYAGDSSGLSRSCGTSDEALLAIIRSIDSNSMLTFEWDASGHCVDIQVDKSSSNAPIS